MKILVFSDSHLSRHFDKKKFRFLKRIISSVDRCIINGDFWEGYGWAFDEFIRSPWKKLFPLLKKKKTIYVFGNHDKKTFSDRRVSLFSIKQTGRYKLRLGTKTFYFEHGDRIVPFYDKIFDRMPHLIAALFERLEELSVKLTGMKAIQVVYGHFNEKIKKEVASRLKKNEYLVCGHISVAQMDLQNHYINSGWIKHGIGQYVMIEDGEPTLHEERY